MDLQGTQGADTLTGGADNDTLYGFGGNDTLKGLAGDDVLAGHDGADTLQGGAGDDYLLGGAGNDTLDGGDGNDWAAYEDATAGVKVDLNLTGAQNTGGGGTDKLVSIENVYGSAFNDTLTGNAGDNMLVADAGNDTISGGKGDDTLWGDAGNDILDGGDGDDWMVGGAGDDIIKGGAGVDWASYENATAGVSVDLTKADAQDTVGAGKDTLTGVELLWGSDFADTLTGDAQDNYLWGGDGDDKLYGGAGDDHLSGGNGANIIDGGDGFDTVDYAFSDKGVRIDLNQGPAPVGVPVASDWLASIEAVMGSAHNDEIIGNGFENYLFGDAGDDIIRALGGNDTVDGGDGNDVIYSGGPVGMGDDLLLGGAGDDRFVKSGGSAIIDGGEGVDTFQADTTEAVTIDLNIKGMQTISSRPLLNMPPWILMTADLSNIENLTGGSGNDTLIGDAKDNVLSGGFGSDILDGRGGSDTVSYADENYLGVVIDLGKSVQVLSGNRGSDTLLSIENVIGSTADDEITGNADANRLQGGAGNDKLIAVGGGDLLEGEAGNDILTANKDNKAGDRLFGGAGNDTLISQKAAATLDGGDGDDTFVVTHAPGMTGTTVVTGGTGVDTLDMRAATANLKIDLSLTGRQDVGGGHFLEIKGVEKVLGGAGNDVLKGDAGDNWLQGGAGDDTLDGGAGFDFVSYDDAGFTTGVKVDLRNALQTELGGRGKDTLVSIEGVRGTAYADTLIGDAKDNIFVAGLGDDKIDGGDGFDYISYLNDGVEEGANISLRVQDMSQLSLRGTKTLVSIEGVIGSNYGDGFLGSAGANILRGGLGNDSLSGGGGADMLDGGDGDDILTAYYVDQTDGNKVVSSTGTTLLGGDGADWLELGLGDNRAEGGAGVDWFFVNNLAGDKIVDGGANRDMIQFHYRVNMGMDFLSGVTVDLNRTDKQQVAAGVTITLTSVEDINGSLGDDVLTGNAEINVLNGNDGADILRGNGGDDILFGGAGDDILVGGRGIDILDGGEGVDTFVFRSGDASSWGAGSGASVDTIQSWQVQDRLLFTTSGPINYAEKTAASLKDAIALASELMGDQKLTHMAVQVGNSVYVFVIQEGASWNQDVVALGYTTLDQISEANFKWAGTTVTGDDGANLLVGTTGDDTLSGGAGADVLVGGWGKDTLTGGTGADLFKFLAGEGTFNPGLTTADVITDFGAGDKLAFAGAPAVIKESDFLRLPGVGAVNPSTGAISVAAQLTIQAYDNQMQIGAMSQKYVIVGAGADTYVLADTDGGGFDQVVLLKGVTSSLVTADLFMAA